MILGTHEGREPVQRSFGLDTQENLANEAPPRSGIRMGVQY
jgi:hypothetical protein